MPIASGRRWPSPSRATSASEVANASPRLTHPGGGPYLPALDGLRALAVLAVLGYHLGIDRMRGGYLGVDVFFVLSGFLITGLLIDERARTGGIAFGRFYARRARRLLPALYLLLVVLSVWVAVGGAAAGVGRAAFRADALAAIGYVANWRFVLHHQGYFSQFAVPSPLRHVWSLAIEEQFYLVWPAALAGLLVVTRGSRRHTAAATAVLAVASAAGMALLYRSGADPSRAYYGTDTRAFELLAGAVLALVATRPAAARRPGRWAAISGWLALGGLAVMVLCVGDASGWMYRGGFVLVAALATVVVRIAGRPDAGALGRCLSLPPLRWLGRVSYGLYLWHWPVIDLLTSRTTGVSGNPLRALQVGVALGACTISYYVLEQPVRRGRPAGWPARLGAAMAPVLTAATVVGVSLPLLPAASAAAAPASASGRAARALAVAPDAPAPSSTTTSEPPSPATPAWAAVRHPTAADPLRVLVVGDSVMWDASLGIRAALEATGTARVDAHPLLGFGLTRPGYHWRTEWPTLVAADRPDVVIGLLGGWDGEAAEARGAAWYQQLVDEATGLLAAGGAHVLWLEYPRSMLPDIPGTAQQDHDATERRRELTDAAFMAEASRRPALVAYLALAPVIEQPGGGFATFLPGASGVPERVRKHDGLHLCPAGARRVGAWVEEALSAVYALPVPTAGWEDGAWTRDSRYDTPAGACA